MIVKYKNNRAYILNMSSMSLNLFVSNVYKP